MKIKILTSCAGLKFSFSAGDVVDTDSTTANDLILAGHAEEVKPRGKGDNAADGGTSKSGGVPSMDAGAADQHGTGTDGKQPVKSGA